MLNLLLIWHVRVLIDFVVVKMKNKRFIVIIVLQFIQQLKVGKKIFQTYISENGAFLKSSEIHIYIYIQKTLNSRLVTIRTAWLMCLADVEVTGPDSLRLSMCCPNPQQQLLNSFIKQFTDDGNLMKNLNQSKSPDHLCRTKDTIGVWGGQRKIGNKTAEL